MSQGDLPVFQPLSPQAGALSHLFIVVLVVCAIIFAVVVGLIVASLLRFRRRPGGAEPRQVFGHQKLEITWTVVPFLIVVWLTVLTIRGMTLSDTGRAQSPDLVVIGHQWWWEVHYPGTPVVTANEIHIPVGRKLRVNLEAADVIHDFWVPQLARKMDMIPGTTNHIWLQADRPGVYLGSCGEYCGAEHAWMRFTVVAQPPAQYAAWLRRQEQPASGPVTPSARRGLQLFKDMTCVNCHPLRGFSTAGNAGPDLTHLADRSTLAGGVLPNTRDNLALWLKDPQAIKPACRMPNLNLTGAQIDDLVNFLEPQR